MSKSINYCAYIDECGTNALDTSKANTSNLFICTAVILPNCIVEDATLQMQSIAAELCGSAEIKSSSIGTNHQRRLKFLQRISAIDFEYYALIVNKDNINKACGLQYKKSYYKFFNKMIYDKIISEYSSIHIFADQIGSASYMESYHNYFSRQMPNLLSKHAHSFANSASTPLLQLADLVSGTLSYCYDPLKKSDYSLQFLELLRKKELRTFLWPIPHHKDPLQTNDEPTSLLLAQAIASRAQSFIEEKQHSTDTDEQMQAIVLMRLHFNQYYGDQNDKHIPAGKLISHLHSNGYEKLTEPAFRKRIIGRLRDAGMLITGTTSGYRLCTSDKDVFDYLDHNRHIIEPMLSRVATARTVLRKVLDNDHKYFSGSEFQTLTKITDYFQKLTIEHAVTPMTPTAADHTKS